MPVVKDTVDRLMKGYDIRLRPDFGGKAAKLDAILSQSMTCCTCTMTCESSLIDQRRIAVYCPLQIYSLMTGSIGIITFNWVTRFITCY